MVYAAPMNENCFPREGAKNIFSCISCISCVSWFKSIFTVTHIRGFSFILAIHLN